MKKDKIDVSAEVPAEGGDATARVPEGPAGGTGEGAGKSLSNAQEGENRLFLLFVARLAATDTYRTTERPETRFKRALSEAKIALEIFGKEIKG